jgi:hypothetical protein
VFSGANQRRDDGLPQRVRAGRQATVHVGPMPTEIDQVVEFVGSEFTASAVGVTRSPAGVADRYITIAARNWSICVSLSAHFTSPLRPLTFP